MTLRAPPVGFAVTIALLGLTGMSGWGEGESSAWAQFPSPFSLPQISPRVEIDELRGEAKVQLDRLDDLLADQQYDEAIETLRRVTETQPHALVRVPPANLPAAPDGPPGESPRHALHLPLREYAQRVLAGWSQKYPAALALYRRRVDPLAERWFVAAVAAGDAGQLQRMVEELLLSSRGDDALLALGELELNRGRPAAARALWERISPRLRVTAAPPEASSPFRTAPGAPWWPALAEIRDAAGWQRTVELASAGIPADDSNAYPDSDIDLATVRARLVLASLLEGNRGRAALELELFRRLHPAARGALAGREVNYAEFLTSYLEESARWLPLPAAGWTTFAGTPERANRAVGAIEVGGRPLWEIDLGAAPRGRDKLDFGRLRVAEDRAALLSLHPLVVGDVLVVQTEREIRVYDRETGQPAWTETGVLQADRPGELPVDLAGRREMTIGVPRRTLTVWKDWLFARCGEASVNSAEGREIVGVRGYLIGRDLRTQGKLLPGFPLDVDERAWAFEGTPLCDGERLLVAMRRSDTQLHVACFDLATAQLRWRRRIAAAETLARGEEPVYSHALLTRHEDTLYYSTHAGAVAALDVREGAIRWLATYPRAVSHRPGTQHWPAHWFRDLTPAVYDDGYLLVAPADGDHLFALDAATGAVVWETPSGQGDDIVHLLGVGQGSLIASGDYLYWIDRSTGQVRAQFPESGHPATGGAKPSPAGYGRGLLVGDLIYWPTREQIYVFHQRLDLEGRPQQARQPIDLVTRGAGGGNLLVDGQRLIVAGARKIWAFDDVGRVGEAEGRP